MAAFIGVPEVQIECSGTAALVVALTALKQDSTRTSVVIPAYTCPLVAIAVVHCGLKPVLCDLKPGHFDLDPEALEKACTEDTLAVIPTHLGGRVADLDPVLAIAHRVAAYVIEDAAQALGAQWHGQSVGLAGDIGFFSLAVGKGLTIFEGGVLVAKDAAMRARLRAVSEHIIPSSIYWETRRLAELAGYTALYNPTCLHYAYGNPLRRDISEGRLVEAVGDDFDFDIPLHRIGRYRKGIGAKALTRLPAFLHQLNAQSSRKELFTLPVMEDVPNAHGTWPYFMVLMPTAEARDEALRQLWSAGLGVTRLFIHALPDYGYLKHLFPNADVPNARDFAARMLTVSNSVWMNEEEMKQVRDILEEIGKRR
ncbi:erythromycin biosynthesis sensory transduction protein eryC1 [Novimethylophilus kurashikiensis]|uniref:Erythromycin biosynthesis sensory transduction protein eryC1 n=2 Tax=Novimethylophilus kurashikiensis TaxID=1825523 RepID=A0A2R5FAC7_9PROT|nr:erythromycin biosynthesis sensory transduction protein eryC1 [Novimethylophilus kurashikiensis]